MGLTRSVVLTLIAIVALAACNEDNTLGLGVSTENRYSASLSGANVRPVPVATTATATTVIAVREPQVGEPSNTLAYTITTSNVTSATAAHIHLGGPSVGNGPILATLYSNPTDTALTSTQLVSGAVSGTSLGSLTIDSLAKLVEVGAAYVDIHTTANPNGLIRGQLTKSGQQVTGELFAAPTLNGANERPTPVVSTATGVATFQVQGNSSVQYRLDVAGITGAIVAHIHTGVADSAGPVAVTLYTSATPTGPLTGTLASGSFTGANIQLQGISLDSLLSLMRRGRTYVNVHTSANPSGEIRAQIEPVTVLPK